MMRVTKLLFLVKIYLLSISPVFSQTDFRDGFIITNEGDTIKGLINYRERRKSFEQCEFKSAKDGVSTTYLPTQIKGYGYNGFKVFVSKEIKFDKLEAQFVFLEILAKGQIGLYKLNGDFWIEREEEGPVQLINETREMYVDGEKVLKSMNQHISILSMLMADCIELRSDIMKGKLRERPLLNLIKAYHDCTAADLSVYKKEKAWIQFTGGIATGVNFSKLKYKSQYSGYEHLVGSYESSSSFAAGITFDVSSPRLSERLSFTTSILSVSSEYSRTSESYRYPAFYKNEISIKINQVKIPIGIKYTFAERKFTPFINTGISGAFHTRSDGNWDETVQPFNTTPTVNNYKLVLKRNQLGLWAGAGVIVSVMPKLKCWLEVRYEATNGIAPFLVDLDDLRSNISNIQFLIGLKLN